MPDQPIGPADPPDTADSGPVAPTATSNNTDAQPSTADPALGLHLEPLLKQACNDKLSKIRWFRTDWQRGGALTGYGLFADESAADQHPVVVKLPVTPVERYWLTRLQHADNVAPRLYAHGDALAGYDFAWVVMERLPHGPLSPQWEGHEFDLLVQAAARFYSAADSEPRTGDDIGGAPVHKDWAKICTQSREHARDRGLHDAQRWNKALKKAQKKLKDWTRAWEDRPTDGWCHGDMHLGNAMTRMEPPGGPAILFDYALTRRGYWVEDAVYLEHLYWGHREKLNGRKLCKLVAQERKTQGLTLRPDWPKLATVCRCLFAIAAPAVPQRRNDPYHMRAALEVLERHL